MITFKRNLLDNFIEIKNELDITFNVFVDNFVLEPDLVGQRFIIKDRLTPVHIITTIYPNDVIKINDVPLSESNFKALGSLIQEKLFFVVSN